MDGRFRKNEKNELKLLFILPFQIKTSNMLRTLRLGTFLIFKILVTDRGLLIPQKIWAKSSFVSQLEIFYLILKTYYNSR